MSRAERLANTEYNIIMWRGHQRDARTPEEAERAARVVDASLDEWKTISEADA